MNKLINPLKLFIFVQIVPLIVWLIVPSDVFDISLQFYDKPNFGFTSLLIYAIVLLSFYFGYKVSCVEQKNAVRRQMNNINLKPIILLHNTSLLLSFISVIVVVTFCFDEGINVLDTIISGQGNAFNQIVYSKGAFEQILIMGRHLLFTSAITWFILSLFKIRKNTFPLIVLMSILLFLLTSSRLSLMMIIIIGMLFHCNKPHISKAGLFKITMVAIMLLVVFGIAVLIRSKGTWASLTGSSNLLIIACSEFVAYFISPVNYSIALIEQGQYYFVSSVLNTFFAFILSVLNMGSEADKLYLDHIYNFYNPSLNQIGLVGTWYTGFGPFLFIPTFVLGYISGKTYKSFINQHIGGMLFYPLVFFSLFDSFRGFLLTQSVIMSNILFIGLFRYCYSLFTRASKNEQTLN